MSIYKPEITIIGNWKMHKTIIEARTFVAGLAVATMNCSTRIGLAVPYTIIEQVAEVARGTCISIGAQNVSDKLFGAYTGEVSCDHLKDAGASFVIIGHSERRQYYQEDNATINAKVKNSLDSGLKVILCVGETFADKQAGRTFDVINNQLAEGLKGIHTVEKGDLMLAYEPVWAIGSEQTAAVDCVQAMNVFCKQVIYALKGLEFCNKVAVLYGGSVRVDNALKLLDQSEVNGLLVGGASLSLDSFVKIIQCQL